MSKFSKAQINRLGDRLRGVEKRSDEDLIMLKIYRESFNDALEHIVETLEALGQAPTQRVKTELSIVEKLRRSKTRLSEMQDIVGCRIVVQDVIAQNSIVALLENEYISSKRHDRRSNPSHGYRAVHLICRVDEYLVEIQVRTYLQHRWAELSEKIADTVGIEIKYGGGDSGERRLLDHIADMIEKHEWGEVLGVVFSAEGSILLNINKMEQSKSMIDRIISGYLDTFESYRNQKK